MLKMSDLKNKKFLHYLYEIISVYTFLYKQPVHKQLALGWQIAK